MVAGAAATTALVTSAVKGYAEYEQLIGGVDTLFKDSSAKVQEYAANAYKTAGLSANEYMSTVTSFSASLLQSLGGDTEKAAQYADQAITDMSDNANKMGTDMGMIQNAYQGFAKQNYTMLDNLKLGYGGTKTEMERLLTDAEKISGIKYDISSFADVTEAIHVMQTEIGITGTTAKEASTTIEGSTKAMKAAWSNLIVGIADDSQDFDTLVNNFVDSVGTMAENIMPRIETAIGGVGKLVEKLLPVIVKAIPSLINNVLPQLIESGGNMVNAIIDGLQENLPQIIDGAMQIVEQLVSTVLDMLPQLIELGLQIIVQLALGIAEALPELVPQIVDIMLQIVQILIENLPLLIDAGLQIILGLVDGLIAALPVLIEALPQIIDGIISGLITLLPLLIDCGIKLFLALIEALPDIIVAIVEALPQIIESIIDGLMSEIPQLVDCGIKLFVAIIQNLPRIIVELCKAVPQIISSLIEAFNRLQSKFIEVGKNIVEGLWNGIKNSWSDLVSWVKEAAGDILSAVKGVLGIASPSKKFRYFGEMCVAGFDEGIDDLMKSDSITKTVNASFGTLSANARYTGTGGSTSGIDTDEIKSAVANNDQITEGIKNAVIDGMMQVFMATNTQSSGNGNTETHIHVQFGDTELGVATYKGLKSAGRKGLIPAVV